MSDDRVHTSLTELPELFSRAGAKRVLIVTGQSQRYVERLRDLLANLQLAVFAGARRHVPEEVASDALRTFDAERPDAILALGGGSAIGLCKALRLERQAYFVAVPTTYSGSERHPDDPANLLERADRGAHRCQAVDRGESGRGLAIFQRKLSPNLTAVHHLAILHRYMAGQQEQASALNPGGVASKWLNRRR
jgi:hypothetical protein